MGTSGPHGNLVGQRFGKYDLLALLAVGGTAEIYLARIGGEAGFEKYVVCKCLLDHLADQPEYVRMFLDEARIGAQLDHSNIVQTLELGEHHGRYYMVMEYLAGMSLSTMAKKSQERVAGGLPIDVSLCLCAQACAGLHYAHERTTADGQALNIIHRDVSPQNLVVSFEGVLKLVDFGIAKAEMRETHTKSGTIKGKFAYMSPEQCLGQDLDRRTDIFSLGTILHELLTGQRLFKRGSTYDTYQAIVNGEVKPPSQVNHRLDPGLDDVVMRALAYDRANRYPTAEAFGEALLQVLHRRGKSIAASDVARFFDQHFVQEIDVHAARMRELVTSGRATMQDISWHAPELASDSASQMPDELPPRAPTDLTMDESPPRDLDDAWSTDAPEEQADEDDGGGATRIEPNPLLRVQTMHAQEMKRKGGQAPVPQGKQRARTGRPTSQGYNAPKGGGDDGPSPRTIDAKTIAHRAATKPKPAPGGRATLMMPAGGAPMPERAAPRPAPRSPSQPAPLAPIAGPTPTAKRSPGPGPGPVAPPGAATLPSRADSAPTAAQGQAMRAPSEPPTIDGHSPAAPSLADLPAVPVTDHGARPGAPAAAAPSQPARSAPQQAAPQQTSGQAAPAASPAPREGAPEHVGPTGDRFPPVHTPTAFRRAPEALDGGRHAPAPGDDLYALAGEPRAAPAMWMLVVAFLVSAGVGLGATVAVLKALG